MFFGKHFAGLQIAVSSGLKYKRSIEVSLFFFLFFVFLMSFGVIIIFFFFEHREGIEASLSCLFNCK